VIKDAFSASLHYSINIHYTVFSVTQSFRNRSNTLIWCSRKMSYYISYENS